ncbi:hypothetical protein GE09DRAFT_1097387 [Coniochaeta sp. 2T2.1]|nr:hypothetical protein GE09DRAFT_1097387 [Coniochaeta sp. 2T2.1]
MAARWRSSFTLALAPQPAGSSLLMTQHVGLSPMLICWNELSVLARDRPSPVWPRDFKPAEPLAERCKHGPGC